MSNKENDKLIDNLIDREGDGMKLILRVSNTDSDMVEIVTKTIDGKTDMLWGVVHQDLFDNDNDRYILDELHEAGEVIVKLQICRKWKGE